MVELLDWAFEKGGAWGVLCLLLTVVVVCLYRGRERDAREHKREQRKNLRFLLQLMSKLREQQNYRDDLPSRPYQPEEDEPEPEDEQFEHWEEPTTVTRKKQDTTKEHIERLVSDYLNSSRAPRGD
jgi:hypothetical protein